MKTLSKRLYGLIEMGVKMTGTYDPDVTLGAFEEQLTFPEAKEIGAFLRWCHENGKAFGHGNYQERFAEFIDECPDCGVRYSADVEEHKDCAQCNRLAEDEEPEVDCPICGAPPGEVHPSGCADHIESKEKNITTRIYTYDVELDISYDGGDLVSSCFISKTRGRTLYCSSLALLSDQGTIEGDNWGDVIHVPDKIITKIYHWAEDNGY